MDTPLKVVSSSGFARLTYIFARIFKLLRTTGFSVHQTGKAGRKYYFLK